VTVEDALNVILAANGFTFEKQPNSNIFVVKDTGVSAVSVKTKIYKLSYASVSGAEAADQTTSAGIETILQELLSENGKIVVDPRTNSIIVSDVPSSIEKIDETLKELDIKTPQVMISAEILEVSVETLKRLGVEWGSDTGQFMTYTGGSRSSFWPFKETLFKNATESASAATVSFSSFTAVLKAIKTATDTQYLARPRLLTLNNKTAEIKITKDAAVSSSTVTTAGEGLTQATESVERQEVGTTLKITPHINKDGYITLTVEPEVSRVQVSSISSTVYDPYKRSAKTTIMVHDGEPIVIAGLISREDSDANRQVPLLGEVPILGKIFERNTKQRSDTEILIFITPYIIKEEGAAFVTALGEELGIEDIGKKAREGGMLPQQPQSARQAFLKSKRTAKNKFKRFQRLTREQDSQLSTREIMMEKEVLKIKSTDMIPN
jgi:type II secretory pathway component GspD/PulD (secretin)